jgi:hypothetical protein
MLMYSMKWEANATQPPQPPSWTSVPATIAGWVAAPSQEALAAEITKLKSKYGSNVTLSDMEVKTL